MGCEVHVSTDIFHILRHYLYILQRVRSGWYQDRGFLVHPVLTPGLYNSIVLPELTLFNENELSSIFNVDLNAKYLDIQHFDDIYNGSLKDQTVLSNLLWNRVFQANRFWNIFDNAFNLFKGVFPAFGSITDVNITLLSINFGTQTSFFWKIDNSVLDVFIVVRKDIPSDYLVDAFVSTLVSIITNNQGEDSDVNAWRIREELGEIFLYNSYISKFINFDKHKKTLAMLGDPDLQTVEAVKLSKSYLLKHGYPLSRDDDFRRYSNLFSYHELIIAKFLYEKKGNVVTYDSLAEALYGDEYYDKFSLQYLAKIVENIRRKLSKSGVRNKIFTKRGIGYMWLG